MNTKLIYIERQKPFWLRVLASLFFTISFALIIYFIWTMEFSLEKRYWYAHFDIFQYVFLLVFFGAYFSYTINCHFDFEKKTFKREKTIGIFKIGKWQALPDLNYVSMFAVSNTIQINLFHSKNKHWDLYEKFDKKEAFIIAFELSEMLNIDLLDATVPYNYRWIDKEATKKSKEIIYTE